MVQSLFVLFLHYNSERQQIETTAEVETNNIEEVFAFILPIPLYIQTKTFNATHNPFGSFNIKFAFQKTRNQYNPQILVEAVNNSGRKVFYRPIIHYNYRPISIEINQSANINLPINYYY